MEDFITLKEVLFDLLSCLVGMGFNSLLFLRLPKTVPWAFITIMLCIFSPNRKGWCSWNLKWLSLGCLMKISKSRVG